MDEELFEKFKDAADDLAIIYPKEKTQEQAEELAKLISDSIGVAKFEDENGRESWGVLLRRSALEEGDKIGNDSV